MMKRMMKQRTLQQDPVRDTYGEMEVQKAGGRG